MNVGCQPIKFEYLHFCKPSPQMSIVSIDVCALTRTLLTRILDIGMMRRVFYHCANAAGQFTINIRAI
jgi:hypothetical protein